VDEQHKQVERYHEQRIKHLNDLRIVAVGMFQLKVVLEKPDRRVLDVPAYVSNLPCRQSRHRRFRSVRHEMGRHRFAFDNFTGSVDLLSRLAHPKAPQGTADLLQLRNLSSQISRS